MDKLFSLEDVDSLAKHPGAHCESCNGYDMTKRLAEQLADAMRENEWLRSIIHESRQMALDALKSYKHPDISFSKSSPKELIRKDARGNFSGPLYEEIKASLESSKTPSDDGK